MPGCTKPWTSNGETGISQIGLFSFKVRETAGEIYEAGVPISNMMPYITEVAAYPLAFNSGK